MFTSGKASLCFMKHADQHSTIATTNRRKLCLSLSINTRLQHNHFLFRTMQTLLHKLNNNTAFISWLTAMKFSPISNEDSKSQTAKHTISYICSLVLIFKHSSHFSYALHHHKRGWFSIFGKMLQMLQEYILHRLFFHQIKSYSIIYMCVCNSETHNHAPL